VYTARVDAAKTLNALEAVHQAGLAGKNQALSDPHILIIASGIHSIQRWSPRALGRIQAGKRTLRTQVQFLETGLAITMQLPSCHLNVLALGTPRQPSCAARSRSCARGGGRAPGLQESPSQPGEPFPARVLRSQRPRFLRSHRPRFTPRAPRVVAAIKVGKQEGARRGRHDSTPDLGRACGCVDRERMCVCVRACVRVCVSERERETGAAPAAAWICWTSTRPRRKLRARLGAREGIPLAWKRDGVT
jgi:hypothetical protein